MENLVKHVNLNVYLTVQCWEQLTLLGIFLQNCSNAWKTQHTALPDFLTFFNTSTTIHQNSSKF